MNSDQEAFWKTCVAPWVGKFDRKRKKDSLVLCASDFHAQWTDKFTWRVFLDSVSRMQPDVIALVGDVVDFHDLSRYKKDPTAVTNLQGEINYIRKGIFKPLREAAPNALIDFHEGNHEVRLVNYLMEKAPGLADLECLEYGSLFGLDEYEINLVARKPFRRTKPRKLQANFKVYGENALLLTHGTATGQNPAKAEIGHWGMSGISGHLHKPMQYTIGGLQGQHTWTIMGCMARTTLSREYMETPAAWVNGFAYAEISGRYAQVTPVTVRGGFVSVAGMRYYKGVDSKALTEYNQTP